MTNLSELLAKAEAATGPDREIDIALACAIGWTLDDLCHWLTPDGDYGAPPAYTASVDACLALAERVLPGWHWAAGTVPETGWQDALPGDFYASVGSSWAARFYGAGKTPALALLASILKAKIADNASQEIKGVGRG